MRSFCVPPKHMAASRPLPMGNACCCQSTAGLLYQRVVSEAKAVATNKDATIRLTAILIVATPGLGDGMREVGATFLNQDGSILSNTQNPIVTRLRSTLRMTFPCSLAVTENASRVAVVLTKVPGGAWHFPCPSPTERFPLSANAKSAPINTYLAIYDRFRAVLKASTTNLRLDARR